MVAMVLLFMNEVCIWILVYLLVSEHQARKECEMALLFNKDVPQTTHLILCAMNIVNDHLVAGTSIFI
jgi:hypothetical protein